MSHRSWLLLSLAIYGLCIVLPCLSFTAEPSALAIEQIEAGEMSLDRVSNGLVTMSGFELTVWGTLALALFWQVGAVGWLANPIYWWSAVLFSRQQYVSAAVIAGTAVLVGGLGTLFAFHFSLPAGSTPYTQLALRHMLVGFWFWLAAPAVLAVVSICDLLRPGS